MILVGNRIWHFFRFFAVISTESVTMDLFGEMENLNNNSLKTKASLRYHHHQEVVYLECASGVQSLAIGI